MADNTPQQKMKVFLIQLFQGLSYKPPRRIAHHNKKWKSVQCGFSMDFHIKTSVTVHEQEVW